MGRVIDTFRRSHDSVVNDRGGGGGRSVSPVVGVGRRALSRKVHLETLVGGEVEGVSGSRSRHHGSHASQRSHSAFFFHHVHQYAPQVAVLAHQALQASLQTK